MSIIKDIKENLSNRWEKRKNFKKNTMSEAQDIFKKTYAGGRRYWNPKNESRKDNLEFSRILKQVRETREKVPYSEKKYG